MRTGISITVTPDDRLRLMAIVGDRNAKQKHVKRAKVIMATADGCGTNEIMRRSELSKPVVWRWQERFMLEGIEGLLRDKTRKPGKAPSRRDGAACGRSGAETAAGRGDPLDGADVGEGGRREPAIGATHPRGQPSCTAPHPLHRN